jgi:peptide/nickel transport system substrate-binding protein
VKDMPTVSEDGKTVTLNLRDDITWSDGTPITADDFVFTYQMVIDPQNTVSSQTPYDQVASVEAPDPQTVVVTFNDVYAPWQAKLFTFLLPKHILQPVYDASGNLNDAEWNTAPTVGCGPFVFQSWDTGQSATFVANENYFDGRPILDQIIVTFITDNDAQRAAVLAGDSDFGSFLDPSEVAEYEAGGVKIVKGFSGYNEGIFFRQDGK